MDKKVKDILQKWLDIEFFYVANKIGFIDKLVLADQKLVFETIRCIDRLTYSGKNNENVNYVITLISLMWTHINRDEYDIRSFIVKVLSRIGYPTSAIIVDDLFDKEKCVFSPLNSIIDQITAGINQSRNEVEVKGHYYLLTNFQKQIWDAMDTKVVLGISAPTSAGKSFVLLLKIVKKIIEDKIDVLYIVPTLSLLNQVTEDFHDLLKKMNLSKCKISNTFTVTEKRDENYVYVMTQEKAI